MNTVLKLTTLFSLLILALANSINAQMVDYDPEFYAANYFELSNLEIPISEIYPGAEKRTGIPALNNPIFDEAVAANNWLEPNDMVLGLTVNGVSKAYPLRVISWHEVVNDQFGDEKVMITYSPLTHSGQAYKGSQYGVSAMVFNNNTLIYDSETRSLWAQMTGQAIAGESGGKQLKTVPVVYTSWKEWKMMHADTEVLSTANASDIDYTNVAYSEYENTVGLPFPVSYSSKKLAFKGKVIGLEVDGKYKAYPFSMLRTGNGLIEDYFNGMKVKIHFNANTGSAYTTDEEGELLPVVVSYWYAWYAFHPKTKIYGFLPNSISTAMLEGE